MSKVQKTVTNITVEGVGIIEVGDVLIGSDRICSVVKIEPYESGNGFYVYTNNKRTLTISDIKTYYKVLKGVSIEKVNQHADDVLSSKTTIEELFPANTKTTNETGVMLRSKALYEGYLADASSKKLHIKAIRNAIRTKTEAIRSLCNNAIGEMQAVISKMESIIFTIEIYAGIAETIEQIQVGKPAPDNTVVHLMQERKYMDEEVGDPQSGGVDYTKLDQFYNWLKTKCDYLNCYYYELLVPYEKCVRVMRTRRYVRHNGNTQWEKEENAKDKRTVVLIRNGTNLYVIDSKLHFNGKLFPSETELADLYESLTPEKMRFKRGKTPDEIVDNVIYGYRQGMILMQGLADRSEVLGSIGELNFLNGTSVNKGDVKFVYELDDNLITDGSETFLDFMNKHALKKGDRILFRDSGRYKLQDRLYKIWFRQPHHCPYPAPSSGVYKIEKDKEGNLFFRYNPKDTVYSRNKWGGIDSHERKNSLSFLLKDDDNFWCPFDVVTDDQLDWIEKMEYDRRDRKQYVKVITMLSALKKAKRKEIEEEQPFTMLLMSKLNAGYREVRGLIYWWKNKNMHKRSLDVDDEKAIRMITKRHLKTKPQ